MTLTLKELENKIENINNNSYNGKGLLKKPDIKVFRMERFGTWLNDLREIQQKGADKDYEQYKSKIKYWINNLEIRINLDESLSKLIRVDRDHILDAIFQAQQQGRETVRVIDREVIKEVEPKDIEGVSLNTVKELLTYLRGKNLLEAEGGGESGSSGSYTTAIDLNPLRRKLEDDGSGISDAQRMEVNNAKKQYAEVLENLGKVNTELERTRIELHDSGVNYRRLELELTGYTDLKREHKVLQTTLDSVRKKATDEETKKQAIQVQYEFRDIIDRLNLEKRRLAERNEQLEKNATAEGGVSKLKPYKPNSIKRMKKYKN